MSFKQMLETKISMAAYDNIKLQKKARGILKSVKDVEKTLGNLSCNKKK